MAAMLVLVIGLVIVVVIVVVVAHAADTTQCDSRFVTASVVTLQSPAAPGGATARSSPRSIGHGATLRNTEPSGKKPLRAVSAELVKVPARRPLPTAYAGRRCDVDPSLQHRVDSCRAKRFRKQWHGPTQQPSSRLGGAVQHSRNGVVSEGRCGINSSLEVALTRCDGLESRRTVHG